MYFCSLTQDQLAHTLFPGRHAEDAVRAIAEEQGFAMPANMTARTSALCRTAIITPPFLGNAGQPMQPGNFVDEQGHVIGRHKGPRGTPSASARLGISAETRLFVSGKNMAENTVTVGLKVRCFAHPLLADEWNWIAAAPPWASRCPARPAPATPAGTPGHRHPAAGWPACVDFAAPSAPLPPARPFVLYNGESVIGGGTILNVE